jgi:hypothetical protein
MEMEKDLNNSFSHWAKSNHMARVARPRPGLAQPTRHSASPRWRGHGARRLGVEHAPVLDGRTHGGRFVRPAASIQRPADEHEYTTRLFSPRRVVPARS